MTMLNPKDHRLCPEMQWSYSKRAIPTAQMQKVSNRLNQLKLRLKLSTEITERKKKQNEYSLNFLNVTGFKIVTRLFIARFNLTTFWNWNTATLYDIELQTSGPEFLNFLIFLIFQEIPWTL